MIHFHIAYPGGSIDGSFSIAPCPIIEHPAPSNAHSPSSSSFVAPCRTTGASQATVTEISFSNASPKLAAGDADPQPARANTHPHPHSNMGTAHETGKNVTLGPSKITRPYR